MPRWLIPEQMEQERLQQLIDKVLKGSATAQEQAELDAWYTAQDSGEGLTTSMDETGKQEMGEAIFTNIQQRIERPRRTWLWAAAVLVVLGAGALYFFLNKPSDTIGVIVSVWKEERADSELKKVALPDGSSIWLNSGSSIRYDSNFVSGKREVWMKGEAFFDVAHVEGKPFEVHTYQLTTRVLGTAFNIDAYTPAEHITIVVKRGRVTVADAAHTSNVLLPDARLACKPDGSFIEDTIVANDATAWTSGEIVFRDMPLSDVAKRLENKFNIKLSLNDSSIGSTLITARFPKSTAMKDVLEMVAITGKSTIKQGMDANAFILVKE